MKLQVIKSVIKNKKRLRTTCDKYNHILVGCKFQKIGEKLPRNKSIMVLKQSKGRRIIVIEKTKYMKKYLNLLHSESSTQLKHDVAKTTDKNVHA